MKRRILALKIVAGSVAVGLFIFGWALIARTEAMQSVQSAPWAPRRIVIVVPSGADRAGASGPAVSGLASMPELPPIPAPPAAIRTRSS